MAEVIFDIGFHEDDYIFMPACCYNGNRFRVIKRDYPPMYTPEEASADIETCITDVPRPNKDASGAIEVTTGDVSGPCVGMFSPSRKKAWPVRDRKSFVACRYVKGKAMIYYVDPSCGKDENDGLTPQTPKKNYTQFTLRGGDSLLFKRGSIMRDRLITCAGEENSPITYGAYGDGEKPVICGSQDFSAPEKWGHEGNNLWVCDGFEDDEACNIIFNNSDLCGTLRWSKEELCAQGDFYDNRFGYERKKADFEPKIWLYSEKNPAEYYDSIEIALCADRFLVQHADNIIIRDLHLINGGVHAIAGYFGARNVKVLNCDIERFGGKVWSLERKIRFGNGVEYWNVAENIEISGCYFNNIYDSAVTHQGSKTDCKPCNNLIFKNNIFRYCGMAAYEQRDLFPLYAEFSGNVCIDAGEGFSKNGVEMPRNSEIHPQPMGHHLFLWRIDNPTENGKMVVKDNIFHNAPYGAAVYSIISQDAEKQIAFESNTYYTENPHLFTRLGGKNYKAFDEYKSLEKGIKYSKTDITKYIE